MKYASCYVGLLVISISSNICALQPQQAKVRHAFPSISLFQRSLKLLCEYIEESRDGISQLPAELRDKVIKHILDTSLPEQVKCTFIAGMNLPMEVKGEWFSYIMDREYFKIKVLAEFKAKMKKMADAKADKELLKAMPLEIPHGCMRCQRIAHVKSVPAVNTWHFMGYSSFFDDMP